MRFGRHGGFLLGSAGQVLVSCGKVLRCMAGKAVQGKFSSGMSQFASARQAIVINRKEVTNDHLQMEAR